MPLSAQMEPQIQAESPSLLPDDLVPPRLSDEGVFSVDEGDEESLILGPLPEKRGQGCRSGSRIAELDGLFFQLKHSVDAQKAARLAQQIQSVWLRTGSDTVDLLMQWAENAIRTEDYTQAIDFIDNIIELAPECSEGWMRRASLHIQQNDLGAALLDLNEVLQREPRHYNALMQLGIIMEMLEKPQKAIKLYEKALEIYPQLTSLQRRLGRLLESVADVSL